MAINSEISIRGGYSPFGIRRNDHLDVFSSSLDKITQQHEKAIETQSAITKALADIELNEAEDEWKTNYANQIKDEINSLASFGNYSGALTRATMLAGKVASDPALRGRIRAQKEYKTFVDNTLARTDLTDDDKSWALYKNPYKYEDKFDSNGNIVGGTDWKASTRPVGKIDYNQLLATAKQLVHKESGGGTQVMFFDENGKDTTDPSKMMGVKYYKEGKWEGISKDKLDAILESAIDNTPGARARIEQDWNVANWKYDQLSDEEKENNKPTELFASNGKKYSKQEWYNNKFGRAINNMAGINYTSSIKYDSDYSNFMKARAAGAVGGAANDPFGGAIRFATGLGTPAQIESQSIVNKAFGKVDSGVQDIEKAVPAYLRNTQSWTNAKNRGDYSALANLTLAYARSVGGENKQFLEAKAKELKDNASLIASIRKNTSPDDYDAISFNGAFSTGGELPSGNKYTKAFMKIYNNFGGNNASKLRYSFEDDKELNNFVETLGLTLGDYTRTHTEQGLPAIVIDKNNTKNYKAIFLYDDLGYQGSKTSITKDIKENGLLLGLTRYRRRGIVGLDDNNTVLPTKIGGHSTVDVSPWFDGGTRFGFGDINNTSLRGIVNIASSKTKRSVNDLSSGLVTTTTKHMELPGVLAARTKYADDPSKQSSAVTMEYDKAINNIMGMNGSQYEIMAFNIDTNTLTSQNIADRTEALEHIKAYINTNRSNIKDNLHLRIIDGKIGYSITIPDNYNKTKGKFILGEIPRGELVIFNPDDPYLQRMQRDSKFVASANYDRLSRIRGASHNTYDNNELKFDDNGIPHINGRPVGREEAISYLDKDEAYTQLKFSLGNNITSDYTLTEDYAKVLAQFIASYYGYPINSAANIEKAGDLINQMRNELR